MFNVKNPELFVAAIRSKYGWAVAEQAESVINGESLEDQNPNALKYIFDVADSRNEYELAEVLADHLGIEYDSGSGDETEVNRMMDNSVSDEDFLNLVNSKFGWAIHQQAESVLNDEPLDEQNPNALEYIADLADQYGRDDIAIKINSFLEGDLEG